MKVIVMKGESEEFRLGTLGFEIVRQGDDITVMFLDKDCFPFFDAKHNLKEDNPYTRNVPVNNPTDNHKFVAVVGFFGNTIFFSHFGAPPFLKVIIESEVEPNKCINCEEKTQHKEGFCKECFDHYEIDK